MTLSFLLAVQTLSFFLNANDATTQQLPRYRAAAPIAVQVGGDARAFDAVTVTATGPDGTAIRAPLARTATGFAGALRLATPGAWTVALTAYAGPVSNDLAGVALEVVPGRRTTLVDAAVVALSVLLTAAGVLFVLRPQTLAGLAAAWPLTRRS